MSEFELHPIATIFKLIWLAFMNIIIPSLTIWYIGYSSEKIRNLEQKVKDLEDL